MRPIQYSHYQRTYVKKSLELLSKRSSGLELSSLAIDSFWFFFLRNRAGKDCSNSCYPIATNLLQFKSLKVRFFYRGVSAVFFKKRKFFAQPPQIIMLSTMFYKNTKKSLQAQKILLLHDKLYTQEIDRKILANFWSLLYGLFMSVKLFRVLFSLPVNGQNGWTTLNTLRRYNNYIYSYKWYFFKRHFPKTKRSYFLAEYFNLYYQACFYNQWRFNRKKLRAKRFKRRFLDIAALRKLGYINLFRSKYAQALSKKKSKIGTNRNLGLRLGFTKKFRGNLIG